MTGCSSTGFAYRQADWLIKWYVDDYIDFDRRQQRVFDERLARLLHWHRYQELPEYAAFLRGLDRDLEKPLSAEQVEGYFQELWGFWETLMIEALPDIQRLLASLSPAQVEEFLDNLERERRKEMGEYADLDDAEAADERAKRMERFLRRWVGSLDDAQQERISRWAASLNNTYPAALEQRRHWQSQMARALAERGDEARFREWLHTLFAAPQRLWPEDYRRAVRENQRRSAQLFVDLHGSLSDEQRRTLRDSIRDLVDDMEGLYE